VTRKELEGALIVHAFLDSEGCRFVGIDRVREYVDLALDRITREALGK
jgi:hypothetical protein